MNLTLGRLGGQFDMWAEIFKLRVISFFNQNSVFMGLYCKALNLPASSCSLNGIKETINVLKEVYKR